jgi:CRP/FNR family transcriptional regulator
MDLREVLQQMPLFHGLNEEELQRAANIAIPRLYRKKTVVFMEGGDKEAIYFIQDGLIKTYKTDENGNEQIVSLLQSGDMFPHMDFFNQRPYPATAETLVDSHLIAFPVRAFEQLFHDVPAIAIKAIDILSAKLRELQHKLQQFTGHDVNGRIVSFLLLLAEKHGDRQGSRVRIELPLTNQELANSIGTTRETVNRFLSQLKKENVLKMNRSEMVIDVEALKRYEHA